MTSTASPPAAEVASLLKPGGVFANLEVVRCATPELQEEFHRLIEKPGGDPQDIFDLLAGPAAEPDAEAPAREEPADG